MSPKEFLFFFSFFSLSIKYSNADVLSKENFKIPFCCNFNQKFNNSNIMCLENIEGGINYEMDITMDDGSVITVNSSEYGQIYSTVKCKGMFPLNVFVQPAAGWIFFQNGSFLRKHDSVMLPKNEFCFAAKETTATYNIIPFNCYLKNQLQKSVRRNSIAMAVSVPLLIITIGIYLIISKWRTGSTEIFTTSFLLYLTSLVINYSLLSFINLSGIRFSALLCKFMGFTLYFFLQSAFYWLSVLSFTIWYRLKTLLEPPVGIGIFSLYAFGIPGLITAVLIVVQNLPIDESSKPGINEYSCYLKNHYYLHCPGAVILLCNVVMFGACIFHYLKFQRKKKEVVQNNERLLEKQRPLLLLLAQVFMFMAPTWILECVSYFVSQDNSDNIFFSIIDFYNSSQGSVVFLICIMRVKTFQQIKQRFMRRPKSIQTKATRSTSAKVSSETEF